MKDNITKIKKPIALYVIHFLSSIVFLCCFFNGGWCGLQAQTLQITLTQLPENTPKNDTLYLAGNFNGWQPKHPDYQFFKKSDGTYVYTLTNLPKNKKQPLAFKITRGSWQTVEGNENGLSQPNHLFTYNKENQKIDLIIKSWEDLFEGEKIPATSTRSNNVHILADDFTIPQLNRKRRIWVYLPPDYEKTEKCYPVMYMHDGQNLFDFTTSFSGEWEADETFNEWFDATQQGAIVVGIDNGQEHRMDEYAPWTNAKYGGGAGEAYIQFIVETLKPHIDHTYRTLTDAEHTAIGGSSMGGLISFYAALEHPTVFGHALVFSPSFWFSKEVFPFAKTHIAQPSAQNLCLYLLVGKKEGGSMVKDTKRMHQKLLQYGLNPIQISTHYDAQGEHNEAFWAKWLPEAVEWLFAGGFGQ